jgi:3-phenylpropionate/cinnamic acid dioxygenase small subunit
MYRCSAAAFSHDPKNESPQLFEFPWSRTRRFITNVRIKEIVGEEIFATASFLVYRIRSGQVDPLIGRYEYTLRRVDDFRLPIFDFRLRRQKRG